MARNKLLKYCDLHGINDGVLRVFLADSNIPAALGTIDTCLARSEAKTQALGKLKDKLKGLL